MPAPDPEDRAAAAMFVAVRFWLMTKCGAGTAVRDLVTLLDDPTSPERTALLALLAFPGGDAEPVAWRHFDFNAGHWVYAKERPAYIKEWLPLYAAPVAGEAAAILRDLPPYLRHSIGCDGPSGRACICNYDKMEARIRATLAPGGRPRCGTCGGSGIIEDKPGPVGWATAYVPCPACAPAAEGA